jgi:beta-galactosidase/beta-glucuronidase
MTWTVDYGQGPRPVSLPHAWHRDVPVTWEGPATYRTEITVTQPDTWLVFGAVSYEAVVRVNGEIRTTHRGMWDAFAVWLGGQPSQFSVNPGGHQLVRVLMGLVDRPG